MINFLKLFLLFIVLIFSLTSCSPQRGIEKQTTSTDNIEFLINNLSDNNPDVRWDACVELGKKKNPKAVDALIKALGDKDKSVSVCVMWALGKIKDERAIDPLRKFLSNDDSLIGKKAWEAIEKIKPGTAEKPVERVPTPIVRPKKKLTESAVLKKNNIIEEQQQSKEPQHEINYLEALENFKSKNQAISYQAYDELIKLKDKRAVEPLILLLKNESIETHNNAVNILFKIDPDWIKNEMVNNILPDILKGLNSRDTKIQYKTMLTLRIIKRTGAVDPLVNKIEDRNFEIVKGAIESLNEIDPSWQKNKLAVEIINRLKTNLKTPDLFKREISKQTLEIIEGKKREDWTPDIGIYVSDSFHEDAFGYLRNYLNISEYEMGRFTYFDLNDLKKFKLIIFPTIEWQINDDYSYVKEALSKYAADGGTIFCFTQAYGKYYDIFPVPENEMLKVAGSEEDAGYLDRKALLEDYHPVVSGIDTSNFNVFMDGFIPVWPKNSKIILMRSVKKLPGYIIYQYNNGGYVALTNQYNDYGVTVDRSSETDRIIVRDSISWLRNLEMLADIIRPEKDKVDVMLNHFKLKNSGNEQADYAHVFIYNPNRIIQKEQILPVKLNADEEKELNIEISIDSKSKLGIWGVGYELCKDANCETALVKKNYAQGFIVRKNLKYWELKNAEKNRSIESLVYFLIDDDFFIRESALKVLREIDPQWEKSSAAIKVESQSIHKLKDINSKEQKKIVQLLEQINPQWRKSVEAKKEESEFIYILKESPADKQANITAALELIDPQWRKTDDAQKAAVELINILRNNFSEKYEKVSTTLDKIDPQWYKNASMKNSAAEFINIFNNTSDTKARVKLIHILGGTEDIRAVEPLLSALKDNDPAIREKAAWALGEIKDERAVDALMSLLKDSDFNVRKSAAKARMKINAAMIKK